MRPAKAFGVAVASALAAMSITYVLIIRSRMLHWGADRDELSAQMPGDDKVANPSYVATRAVTIAAPPERVWAWLVQVGTGRGGWYSYDWFENLLRMDIKSVNRIVPELQQLAVGDLIPIAPGQGFKVVELRPPVSMLWTAEDFFTMAWRLEALREHDTRLVCRVRARYTWTPAWLPWNLVLFWGPGEAIMTRGMLLGVKRRAEQVASS
jgi:hypothetical protein